MRELNFSVIASVPAGTLPCTGGVLSIRMAWAQAVPMVEASSKVSVIAAFMAAGN